MCFLKDLLECLTLQAQHLRIASAEGNLEPLAFSLHVGCSCLCNLADPLITAFITCNSAPKAVAELFLMDS